MNLNSGDGRCHVSFWAKNILIANLNKIIYRLQLTDGRQLVLPVYYFSLTDTAPYIFGAFS